MSAADPDKHTEAMNTSPRERPNTPGEPQNSPQGGVSRAPGARDKVSDVGTDIVPDWLDELIATLWEHGPFIDVVFKAKTKAAIYSRIEAAIPKLATDIQDMIDNLEVGTLLDADTGVLTELGLFVNKLEKTLHAAYPALKERYHRVSGLASTAPEADDAPV